MKIGFDGAAANTNYNLPFSDPESSDATMFVSGLCMLQVDINDKIHWQNPSPGGTTFLKILRIAFEKETATSIKREYDRIVDEIPESLDMVFELDGSPILFKIKIVYQVTMCDGKALNAIAENPATSRCHVCRKTAASFMNDRPVFARRIVGSRTMSMPTLHSYIRSLEFLLELAYKQPFCDIKKSDLKKSQDAMTRHKDFVKNEVRNKLGVTVDQVRPGYGNTNTGNVAKKCFMNPHTFATCLGIDLELVQKMSNLLRMISSMQPQAPSKFAEEAEKFYALYKKKYAWKNLTPTIHKLIVHGAQIIEESILPIGRLCEDPIETCIREIRESRFRFARKHSRVNNLKDVFFFMNTKSDILVANEKITKQTFEDLVSEVD